MNALSIMQNKLVMGIISYVVFIVSASTHEYSHARSAYRLGDQTAYSLGRLTLNPFAHIDILGSVILPILAAFTGIPVIGWMRAVPVNPYNFKKPEKGQALVSFAGPFANLCIALLSLLVMRLLTIEISGVPLIYKLIVALNVQNSKIAMTFFGTFVVMLWTFFLLNIMLMFFNLLPFPPLDGGWILRFLLPYKGKQLYDKVYPYGFLILYMLMFFGGLSKILGFINNFALRIIMSGSLISLFGI